MPVAADDSALDCQATLVPTGDLAREASTALARSLTSKLVAVVSILAKTPRQFEAAVSSLYLDIALDGRVLCDPRGYAAERLAMLRRLLERLGLRRVRTPEGYDWRWNHPPSGGWMLSWED